MPPVGFGSLNRPAPHVDPPEGTDELLSAIAEDIHAVRLKVDRPAVWFPVSLSLTSGSFQNQNWNKQQFNSMLATVTGGTLYVYFQNTANANQVPDMVLQAADTRQYAFPPDVQWDQWTFYASGATTTAKLNFGNV
jgi:hypothetical protein